MSKELNKAPVEHAGGDERVKCAVCVDSGKVYDISGEGPWKCYACTGSHEVVGYANGDELDNMLDDRTAVLSPVKTSFHTVPVYREARDALEQPSPAQTQPSPAPTLRAAIDVANDRFEVPVAKWGTDLVGEEERPEVAEVAFVLRNIGAMDAEDIDGDNVDLRFEDAEGRDTGCDVSIVEYAEKAADLFEQHDRIVGELRAVIAQLRQHKNDYMDSGQETYRALQNEIREREAEIARLDGLVSGRTAERDAALAEVKRIKTISDNYYALCVERQQQLDAALAMVSGLRSLLNPILCYVENDIERMRGDRDKSDNKETYDLAISLAMKRLKAAQHAVFTTEPGCNTAVELASHITAQAQHSVPEGVTIERDVAGTIHIKVGDFDFIQLQYQRPYTDNASTWKLAERIASLLAAAPGKEVGHE